LLGQNINDLVLDTNIDNKDLKILEHVERCNLKNIDIAVNVIPNFILTKHNKSLSSLLFFE